MNSEQEIYTKSERSEASVVRRIQVMAAYYLGDSEVVERHLAKSNESIVIAWRRDEDSGYRMGPLRVGTVRIEPDTGGNVRYNETMWVFGAREPKKVQRRGKIWNGKMPRINDEPTHTPSIVESRYHELDYLLRQIQSSLPSAIKRKDK
ncbi:MAG TPA: hypothetical protein VG917_03300 [Patescibacteria group bacterium]|nr:hypothetical protein [Patescibacteria group bacterium]